MKIGYIRVSTQDQSVDRQLHKLEAICDEVIIERISGNAKKRPKFDGTLDRLQEGDSLVVLDLDRAFRSTVDALLTADRLLQAGVHFEIVNQQIDTSTEAGRMIFTILSAFAQFERETIARRTREGLAAAKRRGVKLGPPFKLDAVQMADIRRRYESGETIAHLARLHGVHPSSLSRRLATA